MTTVLQVIPSLDAGGAERTTIEVAEALTARGWTALVASQGGALTGELEAAGGRLVAMPVRSKNPLVMAANARRLKRLIAERGVNLVHARSRAPAWSALAAARAAAIPFITTYHGTYSGRPALKRAYSGVMARGDIVIANSLYMRDRIVALHHTDPDRIRVIPRGVDLARFDPAAVDADRVASLRAAWGLAADDARPLILLPGRMTTRKGHDVALQALARMSSKNAVLVFVGQGPARPAIEQAVARLGLQGRAILADPVRDMPAAYAASALVLAPSTLPEGFGRTAAEAQAMGAPVIASAHGGALEVVEDGETGWLVPPGDAGALAAAMDRALTLTAEARGRMAEAGRARIASLYTARALQDATLRVYEEALALR